MSCGCRPNTHRSRMPFFVSHEGGAKYGFDQKRVEDGDEFEFGDLLLTARHTPGHTPEPISAPQGEP